MSPHKAAAAFAAALLASAPAGAGEPTQLVPQAAAPEAASNPVSDAELAGTAPAGNVLDIRPDGVMRNPGVVTRVIPVYEADPVDCRAHLTHTGLRPQPAIAVDCNRPHRLHVARRGQSDLPVVIVYAGRSRTLTQDAPNGAWHQQAAAGADTLIPLRFPEGAPQDLKLDVSIMADDNLLR